MLNLSAIAFRQDYERQDKILFSNDVAINMAVFMVWAQGLWLFWQLQQAYISSIQKRTVKSTLQCYNTVLSTYKQIGTPPVRHLAQLWLSQERAWTEGKRTTSQRPPQKKKKLTESKPKPCWAIERTRLQMAYYVFISSLSITTCLQKLIFTIMLNIYAVHTVNQNA